MDVLHEGAVTRLLIVSLEYVSGKMLMLAKWRDNCYKVENPTNIINTTVFENVWMFVTLSFKNYWTDLNEIYLRNIA